MVSKSIDQLISSYISKKHELAELGAQIRSSEHNVVITFVDLAGSTALKGQVEPDEWLGYVYRFIAGISRYAKDSEGTIIKRIGDELMLTFESVAASERFIDSVGADRLLGDQYRFKIAADTGPAYHFQFEEPLADDPYGTVVDRCARIAKLAQSGLAFCSSAYAAEAGPERYQSVGTFPFKGLAEPEEVFVRPIMRLPGQEDYLGPLLEALNDPRVDRAGYRFTARRFTGSDFADFSKSRARPFLLRELVNVPRLPYSLAQFEQKLKSLPNAEEASDYYGYFVEWEVVFDSYERLGPEDLFAFVRRDLQVSSESVSLLLPRNKADVVRMIPRGSRLHVRGIISAISALGIQLNYVDFVLAE
jgi:class 3 adenylate cyclase